jgi:outer membrane receptor protein involved in Fe transport
MTAEIIMIQGLPIMPQLLPVKSAPFPTPGTRRALAVAISTAVGGLQHAQAQGLEEIVVTATKREANIQDIPQSVTAFTGDDIAKQGFDKFDDYAKFVPGLAYGKREPGGTSIVFRGVASSGLQFGERPSSSVYLDEQPITAAGVNPDPRLLDIERVEALSGPQGTLFGDASQAGTLRIITNKADASTFEGWVEAAGNKIDGGDAGYDVSAMVNIPIAEDQLALRLVGFHAEEAGFIDNVLSPSPGGTFDNSDLLEEDINTQDYTGGRATLRWTPNADITLDISAIYQETDTDGFGDMTVGAGDLEQIRFQEEQLDERWYQFAGTLEAKMGWADGLVTIGYFDRKYKYDADATDYQFVFNQTADYIDSLYAGDQTVYDFGGDPRAFATEDIKNDRFTIEARLSTPADSDSKWQGLVGVFYNRSKGYTLFSSGNEGFATSPAFDYLNYIVYAYNGAFAGPSTNWFFGEYDSTLNEHAIFGELSFDFTENFTITIGGRWYLVQEDFSLLQGGLMQTPDDPDPATDYIATNESSSSSETGFVPKANITYHIDEDKLIYYTYSEGFRGGGTNPVRPSSIISRSYKSDKLINHEIGAKTTWFDGRFQLNLTAYRMDWDDIQIQVEDPQPLVFSLGTVNFPSASIDGIEAAMSWLPADRWNLQGSVAYNDATLADTIVLFPLSAEPTTASEGTRLPITPEWKAAFSIEYTFAGEWFGAEPYARFDYSYTGESINSLEGVESVVFAPGPTIQDPFHVGDLQFGLEADSWSASVNIDNVWDERGEVFFSNRWGRQRLSINQPLTFGITFRKNFDFN